MVSILKGRCPFGTPQGGTDREYSQTSLGGNSPIIYGIKSPLKVSPSGVPKGVYPLTLRINLIQLPIHPYKRRTLGNILYFFCP
jgi:hypothetical protein